MLFGVNLCLMCCKRKFFCHCFPWLSSIKFWTPIPVSTRPADTRGVEVTRKQKYTNPRRQFAPGRILFYFILFFYLCVYSLWIIGMQLLFEYTFWLLKFWDFLKICVKVKVSFTLPCKRVSPSTGALLGNLEGVRLQGLLREKEKYIWVLFLDTEAIKILSLRPSGTLAKDQSSPELISDYGAQSTRL